MLIRLLMHMAIVLETHLPKVANNMPSYFPSAAVITTLLKHLQPIHGGLTAESIPPSPHSEISFASRGPHCHIALCELQLGTNRSSSLEQQLVPWADKTSPSYKNGIHTHHELSREHQPDRSHSPNTSPDPSRPLQADSLLADSPTGPFHSLRSGNLPSALGLSSPQDSLQNPPRRPSTRVRRKGTAAVDRLPGSRMKAP